jgi:hypothetical protein
MRLILIISAAIFCACSTYGQAEKFMKGVVVNRAGQPISFCNVSIKGSKVAATTNTCGEFELASDSAEFTIVFNCMSTHDFVNFEKKIKLDGTYSNGTILFQLNRHGKVNYKGCKQNLDKPIKKVSV